MSSNAYSVSIEEDLDQICHGKACHCLTSSRCLKTEVHF